MGPILLLVLFNLVVFIMILRILIKHSYRKFKKTKPDRRVKGILKTSISLFSITVMFGLQWLFGALTIADASLAFQWLFVIFCTLQGFFLFFFFVIVGDDSRNEWMDIMNVGRKRGSVLSHSLLSIRSRKGTTGTLSSTLSREGRYTKKKVPLSGPVSSLSLETSTEPIHSIVEAESKVMVNTHAASGERESVEKKGVPDSHVLPHILEHRSVSPQSDKPPSYPSPPVSPIDQGQLPSEKGNVSPESLSVVGKSPPNIFIMTNPEYSHSRNDETTHL